MAKKKTREVQGLDLEAAVREITNLDSERADRLEEIAKKYGLLPQVQAEIEALRHETRADSRRQQLSQTRAD